MNIRKILKLTLSSVIAASLLIGITPELYSASASTSLPVQEENGRRVISIKALCEAMNGKITTIVKEGLTIYEINGKAIYIYDKSYCAFIDGEVAPYETEELTDSVDGKKFNWPKSYKPTKTGDDYLIPVDFFETYTNITNEGDEFVISTKEEVTEENGDDVIVTENPRTSNESQNQGTSTGGSGTSKGSTSTKKTATRKTTITPAKTPIPTVTPTPTPDQISDPEPTPEADQSLNPEPIPEADQSLDPDPTPEQMK
ncbi:MAG TPA: hypothetical protein VIK26_10535 [Clostridium sp.]